MKKFILSVLALVSIIGYYGCQKELSFDSSGTGTGGGTGGGGGTTTGSFKAKINGTQWEANNIKSATIQNGVIVVYGSSTDKKSILLRVADRGVATYQFHDTSMSDVAAYVDSTFNPNAFATNQWQNSSNHGTMSITKIDTTRKLISGTFNINVKQQLTNTDRTITEGVFTDISYTTTPPPLNSTDTFKVKIDGVDFNYNLLVGISTFGMVSVSASANGGTGPTVGITMPSTVVPGNYAFDLFTYVGQYNPNSTTFLQADTGHVQVLEHNTLTKRIRGNFNFFAKPLTGATPTAQLTQGYFSVKYQ